MTQYYRYILEPYKSTGSRYMCPNCRHRRDTFTRYVDTETDNYLANHVGKCDRVDKCGYHFTPREFFKPNPTGYSLTAVGPLSPGPQKVCYDLIPPYYVGRCQRHYHKNNFFNFLSRMFSHAQAMEAAAKYKLGTSKHWPGATIFWQVDINGNVRTGKIMLYNNVNCRRVKLPYNHIAWVHALLRKSEKSGKSESRKDGRRYGNRAGNEEPNAASSGLSDFSDFPDFSLKQCFFGEHLLREDLTGKRKVVCITESEKTAMMASLYYPNCVWLAAGSLDGLNESKCAVLKGRRVVLYPDVNGYAKWHSKAAFLNLKIPAATFTVDDFLQLTATPDELKRGIDLADRWVDNTLMEWEVERGM